MTLPGLVRANNLNDVVDRERAWDNLGSSLATGDISIPAPSLDLNFAANKSLVDDISGNNLITFSRASTGTFVGSNGLIQSAASGVPRFDHNPLTGESLGLLVEEARTNLRTYSSAPNASNSYRIYGTPTYNTGVAPDGTVTTTLITGNGTTPAGFDTYDNDYGQSLNAIQTYSVYVKNVNATSVRVRLTSMSYTFTFATESGVVSSGAIGGGFQKLSNGWYRVWLTSTKSNQFWFQEVYIDAGVATTASIYFWGVQLENATFPTSYIPTVASTVTRAADVASITGANFSSWYNQSEGTVFINYKRYPVYTTSYPTPWIIRDSVPGAPTNFIQVFGEAGAIYDRLGGTNITVTPFVSLPNPYSRLDKNASAFTNGNLNMAVNGTLGTTSSSNIYALGSVNQLQIGTSFTFSRLTYWPARLRNEALQYLTQPLVTSINLYAFNYAINGKDVLALNSVRNTSTRNFIFIKGLLSAAQPRLTAAAASTTSALALATNALPKLSPISSANYFFTAGITLSGVTTRINGTNALSIATSPFSGSTATAPLLFRELRPQANWRFTEPMTSGTIASPEFAIPFETNDFVLFMKAGPN